MMANQTLCALYVATAGLQNNALESDEEEIVLLIYIVIDTNKVIGVQQYIVKPLTADVNVKCCRPKEETAGVSLEAAIKHFDEYIRLLKIDPSSPSFKFITDGQLPLRHYLHPQACAKNITLPDYYWSFYDLRKHFRHFYNSPEYQELKYDKNLIDCLRMPHEPNPGLYISFLQDMVNIIFRLIADGHSFTNPDTIQMKLELGICSIDEEVDKNCVVRTRGIPWQSSDQDVAKFFRGLNIIKGGVAIGLNSQGIRNGNALVRFISQEHRDLALKRHKHHMRDRYIEVFKVAEVFVKATRSYNDEAQAFLNKGAQVIIMMVGLPYDCTAREVVEFFANGKNCCTVMDGTDGVLFVKMPDGRVTGKAFVLFAEDGMAAKALSHNYHMIGSRYIELFSSSMVEVQQVLSRTMNPKIFEVASTPQPPLASPQQMPILPQHHIFSSTHQNCIWLRGLPKDVQFENILEFLGEHVRNIVLEGIHMITNTEGKPSGEAIIQMDTKLSAFIAVNLKHHQCMFYGGKQYYIEVFQCSGDMLMGLAENYPTMTAAPAVSPVHKTLLSPGDTALGIQPLPHSREVSPLHFATVPQFSVPHNEPPLLMERPQPSLNTGFPAATRTPFLPGQQSLYWPNPLLPVSLFNHHIW